MRKKSLKDNGRGFRICNGIILSIIAALMLYPFLYVLFASVSDPNALIRHRGLLLAPKGFNLGAYKLVFKNPNILNGYLNTILYVVLGTTINIMFCQEKISFFENRLCFLPLSRCILVAE